jgi:hypothetical protein
MAERDTNQEALEQVEKATESEPVSGEELVESEDLKKKFREAKKRLISELSKPSGE